VIAVDENEIVTRLDAQPRSVECEISDPAFDPVLDGRFGCCDHFSSLGAHVVRRHRGSWTGQREIDGACTVVRSHLENTAGVDGPGKRTDWHEIIGWRVGFRFVQGAIGDGWRQRSEELGQGHLQKTEPPRRE